VANNPVVDTVGPTPKPVVEPVKETSGGTATNPVVDPTNNRQNPPIGFGAPTATVRQPAPVPASAELDPVLRAEGSATVAPAPDEAGALQGSALQASALRGSSGSSSVSGLAEAAAASSATALDVIPLGIPSAGVSTSESVPASRALVSGGRQVVPTTPSIGEGPVGSLPALGAYSSSMLDSFTTTAAPARDASSQSPQSLPFSGTLPAAPAPSGASGGAGSGGPDLGGVLAALLISFLGGKLLWYARNFLKPDSVYGLLVNQPG
jgi:hypothetical protein